MPDLLTLPAGPGPLRFCSPVLTPRGRAVVLTLEGRQFIGEPPVPGAVVAYPDLHDCEWLPLSDLALDLTDATGRAHAAWWLAGRCGATVPGNAVWWCWYPSGGGWAIGPQHPDPAKCAHVFPRVDPAAVDDIGRQTWHSVPALAALDPNDPRLLPDGSRLIDALALRLVCLHVAGLEVPRG